METITQVCMKRYTWYLEHNEICSLLQFINQSHKQGASHDKDCKLPSFQLYLVSFLCGLFNDWDHISFWRFPMFYVFFFKFISKFVIYITCLKGRKILYSLSFVGSGFFSCVFVFFSLVLSKDATSETSGLSVSLILMILQVKNLHVLKSVISSSVISWNKSVLKEECS